MMETVTPADPIFGYDLYFTSDELCKYLANGLADNWSQVRLSASVAARNFLLSLPNNDSRQLFYPKLLPRMCLNRYYAADGVRIYSQETWRQVTGTAGKELVEQFIGKQKILKCVQCKKQERHKNYFFKFQIKYKMNNMLICFKLCLLHAYLLINFRANS